jgi:hypothetical protein
MACEPTANTSWQLIFLVAIICGSHSRCTHGDIVFSVVLLLFVYIYIVYSYIKMWQLSTCIGCGFTSHSTFQLYINQYQLSTCIECGFTSHSTFQLYINCQLVLAVGSQAIQRFNFISTVNLYWLCVHKPFNVSTLYQLSTCIRSDIKLKRWMACEPTANTSWQLILIDIKLKRWMACEPTANTSWQLI